MPRCLFVIALVAMAIGCDSGPRIVPVSGRILVDDKPVANLRVTFGPIGSPERPYPGPGSVGRTDENGRYKLINVKDRRDGAVVGPCRVRIQVREEIDIKKLPTHTRRLPPRFNEETTLIFEVPPEGTDRADFHISWK